MLNEKQNQNKKTRSAYPWRIHANKRKQEAEIRQKANSNILKKNRYAQTYDQQRILEAYHGAWKRIKIEHLFVPSGGKSMLDNVKAILIRDQILYCFANGGTITIRNLWKEFMGLCSARTPENKEMMIKGSKAYKYLIREADTDYWLEHEKDSLDDIFHDLYGDTPILDD